jgi:hypothetical protein
LKMPWFKFQGLNNVVLIWRCVFSGQCNVFCKRNKKLFLIQLLQLSVLFGVPSFKCEVIFNHLLNKWHHHMLLGVQRVWGNEPSHSQVNSHCRR